VTRPIKLRLLLTALCATAACAALPALAQAKFEIAIQDDPVFLYQSPDATPAGGLQAAYARARGMGVDAIRFNLFWNYWNGYGRSFSQYDRAVNTALANGVKPFFTIVGTPQSTVPCHNPPALPNLCRENAQLTYKHVPMSTWKFFVRTIVRHFDSAGNRRVRQFDIWNEPNLKKFLAPSPKAPAIYNRLYKAAYSIIKHNDPGAKVFIGETTSALSRGSYYPTDFLKKVVSHGALKADGFAHHPFQFDDNAPGRPDRRYEGISNFPLINRVLASLAHQHRLNTPSGGVVRIYGTEFGYQKCGYRPTHPESRRASWGVKAFKFAKRNHALGFLWYQLYHPSINQCAIPTSQAPWDSGLLSFDNVLTPTYNALARGIRHL
jgi:hypothetical protein